MTFEMVMDEKYEAGREEGRKEGKIEAILGLVRDHLLSPSDGAKRLGMTESEFNKEMAKG